MGWDGLTPEPYSETWGHVKTSLLDWRASPPTLPIVRRPNDASPTTVLDAPMMKALWESTFQCLNHSQRAPNIKVLVSGGHGGNRIVGQLLATDMDDAYKPPTASPSDRKSVV